MFPRNVFLRTKCCPWYASLEYTDQTFLPNFKVRASLHNPITQLMSFRLFDPVLVTNKLTNEEEALHAL